jgi:hypothetical protein
LQDDGNIIASLVIKMDKEIGMNARMFKHTPWELKENIHKIPKLNSHVGSGRSWGDLKL